MAENDHIFFWKNPHSEMFDWVWEKTAEISKYECDESSMTYFKVIEGCSISESLNIIDFNPLFSFSCIHLLYDIKNDAISGCSFSNPIIIYHFTLETDLIILCIKLLFKPVLKFLLEGKLYQDLWRI